MSPRALTLDELMTILHESAGAPDEQDPGTDLGEALFVDLGYDSIALLEAAGRLEAGYGIRLQDSAVIEAVTPGLLLAAVNEALAGAR
jgi:act minimal PKS acyl carrier protein